jgi:periplasmic protein CpxP/Spy
MKKWILLALFSTGVMSAQQGQQKKGQDREPLSLEQRTELQVKKLTLDLDLNEKQQKEIKTLMLENGKQRQEKLESRNEQIKTEKGLTAEQRYEMQLAALDHQIAMKESMKKILTKEQFAKWEESHAEQRKNLQKRWGKRKAQQNQR